MLERLITFFVLGFLVFVADIGSWWQAESLSSWYQNYLPWCGLILACWISNQQVKNKPGR